MVYGGKEFDISKFKDRSDKELKSLGILPDIEGIYKQDSRKSAISAVILSHSHLDHYGLLHYLKDEIPIYLSEGTTENYAEFNLTPNNTEIH